MQRPLLSTTTTTTTTAASLSQVQELSLATTNRFVSTLFLRLSTLLHRNTWLRSTPSWLLNCVTCPAQVTATSSLHQETKDNNLLMHLDVVILLKYILPSKGLRLLVTGKSGMGKILKQDLHKLLSSPATRLSLSLSLSLFHQDLLANSVSFRYARYTTEY